MTNMEKIEMSRFLKLTGKMGISSKSNNKVQKFYIGRRFGKKGGTGRGICHVRINGKVDLYSTLLPATKNDTKFDWGYMGDRALNLSASILEDYFETSFREIPYRLIISFKNLVIMNLPKKRWKISDVLINDFIQILKTEKDIDEVLKKNPNYFNDAHGVNISI